MTYRLEGSTFPSILTKTHIWIVPPHWRTRPNVVLHFLGNGLTWGEVIKPVREGEVLKRHWRMGTYTWDLAHVTQGWLTKHAPAQARILCDLLDDCDDSFADFTIHDENEYRADRSTWLVS